MPFTITDQSVASSLSILEENGFTLEILLECSDSDIDGLKHLLPPIDCLKVKLALRKERERTMEALHDKKLYGEFLPYVGRVSVQFSDGTIGTSNAVLVSNQGFAVSALHMLEKLETSGVKAGAERKKGKRQRKEALDAKTTLVDIEVVFPNTREGVLSYHGELASSSKDDDLALIRPKHALPPRFYNVKVWHKWPKYIPQRGDPVFLLSYPACRGETKSSNCPMEGDDLPWFAKGVFICCDSSEKQAVASYSCFGGTSGSLLVHPFPDGLRYGVYIHLGAYCESERIRECNASNFPILNESLAQKACNGYFSLNVGKFLTSYFNPGLDPPGRLARFLHPQVAYVKEEKIEVSGNICNPCLDLNRREKELEVKKAGHGLRQRQKAKEAVIRQSEKELKAKEAVFRQREQVVCTKKNEEIEVLEDLFSPWPGMYDVDDA